MTSFCCNLHSNIWNRCRSILLSQNLSKYTKYLHMRAKGCFHNFWQDRIVPINVMQTDLDITAPHLRNWQGVCQSSRSLTEVNKYQEEDLHLHVSKKTYEEDYIKQTPCKTRNSSSIQESLRMLQRRLLNLKTSINAANFPSC